MRAHAIRIHQHGGPEVMRFEEVEVPAPGQGEVLVRHEAIGLNYIDTYHRSGLYQVPLPTSLGMEGAGIVEAVGAGVLDLRVGDRVAYCLGALGSYAEARTMRASACVRLPADVEARTAAAVLLKGLTAQYLLRRTYRVQPGDPILVHAAAGGVGLLMCQWASSLGATVIGTVGSEDKAKLARRHGCAHPIVYTREDFVARVRDLTGGAGLPVVYDSVGAATFERSLDCLRPFGVMVSFGNSSGAVPPIAPSILATKGSLYLTRPTLLSYGADRGDLLGMCAELFAALRAGIISVEVGQTYALRDAATAHLDLEGRKTRGATLLLP
ncbi:MAG: quinone oxidoreductase [Proteobacteria bacterium]|nr:MAG: quinone oxidoreductase [Pseudomonadota bacterium]